MQLLQLDLHVLAQLLVERPQRLVHQYQLGFEHQGPRQGHALLLPPRQLGRQPVGHAVQPHHRECARDLGGTGRGGHLAHGQRIGHVLAHRHVREQRVVLEHHAEIALVRRRPRDRPAIQQDLAGRRRFEAGQHHQGGRLAGARGAQQREELAAPDVEIELAHDELHAVVGLLDAREPHQGNGGGARRCRVRGAWHADRVLPGGSRPRVRLRMSNSAM